jgi:hypothetical protein
LVDNILEDSTAFNFRNEEWFNHALVFAAQQKEQGMKLFSGPDSKRSESAEVA